MEQLKKVTDYAKEKSTSLVDSLERFTSGRFVRQHKAYFAKTLCDILKPGTVLDASAGWGDRQTGFLASSSVKTIWLIDPRAAACTAFKEQHKDVKSDKDLKVLRGPAETEIKQVKGPVDLCVASPPYWPSEQYSNDDGGQVWDTAKNAQQYLDNFLLPVLRDQAALLSDKGVIALNINDVNDKPAVCQKMLDEMEKCDRLTFAGTVFLQFSKKYEPLYTWCRPDHRDVVRDLLGVNTRGTNPGSAASVPSGPTREGESRADTQEQAPAQEEPARDNDPEEPLYGGCAPFVAGKILNITPVHATIKLNGCIDDAWKEVCDEMRQNARSHRLFRDTNGSPDKSKFVTPGVNGFYALQIVIKMLDSEGVELKRENGNKSKIKQGGPWVITGNLNKNFLGPKFRELNSKYEFDRTQGNDGFIDGTGYHISYVNRGMVHDNNIWVNDDPHLPDYRPIKALHLRLNDQGTPRLSMRPLLDKIYRVYRVVRRSSEDSTTEEDGTGSDGDYTESEVDDAMETDDQPAAATVVAMETEEQPAAAGLSAAAAAAMEIDNDGAQTEESGAKSFIREGNKNDQSVYSEICVKKVYLEEKNYEVDGGKKEQRVSTLPENHTVLDLGAYTGTYAKWKLENGAGKVVCVEPNPDSLAALKTNLAAEIKDGRVIVIEKALDLDCGKTELVEKGYRSRCFPDTFPFTMGPWTD
eukprot:COSAG06_NODE_7293_length_2555_cov_11.340798_2_plen_697_part_00